MLAGSIEAPEKKPYDPSVPGHRGHFFGHYPYYPHGVVVLHQPPAGLDLPAWITAGATVVLAFGVFLAGLQLREARMARITEAAADVSRRWDEDALTDARNAIETYEDDVALRNAVFSAIREEPEGTGVDVNLLLREPNFFDDLGLQELLGGVTLQWIELTMKDIVLSRWDLWYLTVEAFRQEEPTDPPVYGNFQRLAEKLQGQHLGRWQRLKRRFLTAAVRLLDY